MLSRCTEAGPPSRDGEKKRLEWSSRSLRQGVRPLFSNASWTIRARNGATLAEIPDVAFWPMYEFGWAPGCRLVEADRKLVELPSVGRTHHRVLLAKAA